MNKRTFDLIVAVDVGVLILWGGLSMWSRKRLMTGPNSGLGYDVAKISKAATA